jgi:CspA family cold shock protein
MPQGRVKRYERKAGFGFIETAEGDLFVHHTALKDREFLLAGQQVEYEIEQGDRGPRAVDVRVTEDVSPKRKNQPDWRRRRGGAPRFEGEDRVLPGGTGKSRRPGRPPVTDRLGPPRDAGDDRIDATEKESVDVATEDGSD